VRSFLIACSHFFCDVVNDECSVEHTALRRCEQQCMKEYEDSGGKEPSPASTEEYARAQNSLDVCMAKVVCPTEYKELRRLLDESSENADDVPADVAKNIDKRLNDVTDCVERFKDHVKALHKQMADANEE